jgi:hypothetical protein
MRFNTTGSYNTATGVGALASNTTASNNTAVGYQVLYSNTTGANNIGFGSPTAGFAYSTLYSNTTGTQNNAFGSSALSGNTTGSENNAFGYLTLLSNTTGANNTAYGNRALQSNTTASNNTAVGYQAGYNATGTGNTFVGAGAGSNATSGDYNLYVGIGSRAGTAGNSYEMVICTTNTTASGKGSSTGFISAGGGGSIYNGANSATWAITSDRRLKKNIVDNNTGLEKINAIRVRNFEYCLPEEITELDKSNAVNITGVQLGAIAQEIQAVLPDCVKTESTGVMSVDTTNLTWHLINAVKELTARVAQLEAKGA